MPVPRQAGAGFDRLNFGGQIDGVEFRFGKTKFVLVYFHVASVPIESRYSHRDIANS